MTADSASQHNSSSARSDELRPVWVVAFAGHRPKAGVKGRSDSELVACEPALRDALRDMSRRARDVGGRIVLLTGAAEGADCIAAEAAIAEGVDVHVILPMAETYFRDDFATDQFANAEDNPAWSRGAAPLIARARDLDAGGSLRVATGDNVRPDCYHEASLEMLEHADALLAVWNGQETLKQGGTAETIHQAERMGLPVWCIRSDQVGTPSNQIASKANKSDNPPDVWAHWPPRSKLFEQLQSDLAAFRGPLPEQPIGWRADECPEASDDDAGDHADLEPDALERDTADPGESVRWGTGPAWELFLKLDQQANQSAWWFRRLLLSGIVLHFLAAVAATINASFATWFKQSKGHDDSGKAADAASVWWEQLLDGPVLLSGAELFLVAIAVTLPLIPWAHRQHARWRRCRFAAEMVHGMIHSAGLLDPLRPLVARHDRDWTRIGISASLLAHRHGNGLACPASASTLRQHRKRYLRRRIRNQRSYFLEQAQIAKTQQDRWSWVSKWAGITALFVIFAILCIKVFRLDQRYLSDLELLKAMMLFMPVFLPLLAGTAAAILGALDAGRRAARYATIADQLARLSAYTPGAKTHAALHRAVMDTEDILLDERVEWHAAAGNMGH